MKSFRNPVVTGLASYGMSGMVFHAPLISVHPGFRLKSVVQRSGESAKERYPEIKIERDYEHLLRDDEIELVVVNATNDTHFSFAKNALESGKHVVVEKPFVNSVREGARLLEIAEKTGRILSVFQNRRWDADFLTVRKIVNAGFLGRIVEFAGNFDRYRNYIQENTWKEKSGEGSGLLYNLGPHLIDQVLVLFGNPEEVLADIRKIRTGTEVDDYFDISLYYQELKARVHSSYLVREPNPRFILHGTSGSFIKYGLDPQEEALKSGKIPGSANWGTEDEILYGRLNAEIEGSHMKGKVTSEPGNYLAFYENIYEAIRSGKPLAVPALESLANIHVIEKAFESMRTGRLIRLDMERSGFPDTYQKDQ